MTQDIQKKEWNTIQYLNHTFRWRRKKGEVIINIVDIDSFIKANGGAMPVSDFCSVMKAVEEKINSIEWENDKV